MLHPVAKGVTESKKKCPAYSRVRASANQVRAKTQYRSAVRSDRPNASAASARVIPAKKRSFTNSAAASLQPVAIASAIHEDAAHGLGRGGEEVTASVELLVTDETQVRLVDQGGGLQRLAGLLVGQSLRRQSA